MQDLPVRQRVRFGPYELDLRAGEIRNNGYRRRLQDQPLQILKRLLEHPGELVTREELRQQLWPQDTFVDFDHSLNTAVKKLRQALDDNADHPRFIETIPRRGYRFIAAVEPANGDSRASAKGGAAPQHVLPTLAPVEQQPPPTPVEASVAQPERPSAETARARQPRARLYFAAAFSLAAILAVAWLWPFRGGFTRRADINFNARDWVLVSRFENRTGNPVLDGTVDFAVSRELSNSQFVGVAPPERVGDDLRLMENPPGTALDPEVAREICLRDGGIRALITGRIEKVGATYDLSAGVVDPETDIQLAGVESQAADLNGILPAVHQLSNQLRAALGEKLPQIQESNEKLEKVTTPSLRALQLYSQAAAISIDEAPGEKPIPLLEQALADDPSFASAHILLAWCYSNIGKRALAAPHFQKAFDLASTVSERERLFILGSYYEGFKPDLKKSIQAYEVLVRFYPDDYWGLNNLSAEYASAWRFSDAADILARRANLRPNNFGQTAGAWQSLSYWGFQGKAQPLFLRLQRLMTPQIEKEYPSFAWVFRGQIAESDLKAGKIEAASDLTQKLAGAGAPLVFQSSPIYQPTLYELYYQLGEFKLAKEWVRKIPRDSVFATWENSLLTDLAYQRGDLAEERRILSGPLKEADLHDGQLAVKFAKCGMLRQARQQVSRYDKWYASQKHKPFWRPEWGEGSLALAEGRNDDAIQLLTAFVQHQRRVDNIADPAEDDLAKAYEREGRTADAIRTLESWEGGGNVPPSLVSFHLYRLYVKAGRGREAQQMKTDLLHRLAYADPDYPILVQLRKPAAIQ